MNGRNPMSELQDILAGNRKRQILIVEDEVVNLELLKVYLENDYELLCAENGTDAMEIIYAHSETLSLVLLDLRLPDMSGMDILRKIKQDENLARIPIIVLTSDVESEVESLNSGASDFISKPYPRHEIIQARVRRSIELSENRDLIRWTERDQLTGLLNREYFYRFAAQYDRFHGSEPTDAVVLDISHFNMINERLGKEYGDELLRTIGGELLERARKSGGIACRRDADHFQVYCPHKTDYPAIVEQITASVNEKIHGHIRICVGVYAEVDKNLDMEQRFYYAKNAADTIRNSFATSVAFYDDSLHEKELFAHRIVEDFHDALEQKQFTVFYQPKFDIRPEVPELCGAEALIRWKHPELGMISPGMFIPILEGNGLICELDHYVWREAAAQIRHWKETLRRSVPVSVNVSRIDMMDPNLKDNLCDLITENGIDFADLHLEITESAYTQDSHEIVDVVSRLREKGFRIEMDDFGSGYSSLNMLSVLPIDALKLDMVFIRTAFSEKRNTRMIEITLDISHSLGVPMIAEGVETEEQMLALKKLGCEIVQGYYFSKPVPAEEFTRFFKITE